MATPKTTKELNLGPGLGYDPEFGGLCLDGFPHLVARDVTPIDDGLAPLDTSGMGAGSSALKQFLSNPDREAIVAMRDPELLKKYDEQHGAGAVVYANNIPFSISQKAGRWHAKGTTPDGQLHRFTADSRDELFPKITAAVRENTVRALTPDEELHIQRLAQSGDESAAFGQYFLSRIGPQVASMEDPLTELLSDPKYRTVCDEAAFFVWTAQTDTYVPDAAFEEMVFRAAKSKPLSGRLITSIWIQYLDEKQRQDRSALLSQLGEPAVPAPPTTEQLNNLDDASVERLMADTKKQYVREVRAGVR